MLHLAAVEDLMRERVFATAGNDGLDALAVDGTHVEVRGWEIDLVANLGLGLLPESVGFEDHGCVVVLRVGGAYGAGLAVGGASVVEEVELLEEEGLVASLGRLVGRGTAHDAGADDNNVEALLAAVAGIFHLRGGAGPGVRDDKRGYVVGCGGGGVAFGGSWNSSWVLD